MGKQNAYGCDAPKCTNLVPTEKGERGAPVAMYRLTISSPGDTDFARVAFCTAECAQDWLDDWCRGMSATVPSTAQLGAARDEKL